MAVDDKTDSVTVRKRVTRFKQSLPSFGHADQNNLAGLLLILPNFVVFSLFLLGPVLFALFLSTQNWNVFTSSGEWAWTTLFGVRLPIQNYVEVLTPWPWENNWASLRSPSYNLWWFALRNTIAYVVVVVPTQIIGAFLLALALDMRIRGKKPLRAAYFMPVMLTSAASGVIWRWLLANKGVVNEFLRPFGLANAWANDPGTALGSLMLIGLWGGIGFNMIFYLAGLQSIPEELYEAARIDGATGWQRIKEVTWPNLRNTHFFVIVLSIIGTFQVFGIALVFAKGGPYHATTTTVVLIYKTAFENSSYGKGAAMAFMLFAIVFVFSYYQYQLNQQNEVSY
ncbi:carbohydrate ABC transporter permease [Haloarcula sp. JP-L23]|uniref:carbohydrate ABC transporter permease n=1 Tax=Haloarcula sp. JP-L23 TaxID=2716717 RepID=UPI00140F46A9|nr:sugar ABC transporter permease [Haloarcula sp. JP-L23]